MELIPPNFGAINQRNGNIPRNQFGQQNNAFINRNNKKKIVESDKSKNEYKSDDKRTFPKVSDLQEANRYDDTFSNILIII